MMRSKGLLCVLSILIVVGLVVLKFQGPVQKSTQNEEAAQDPARELQREWQREWRDTQSDIAQFVQRQRGGISSQTIRSADKDPLFVIVCLCAEYAEEFPGISRDDKDRIIDAAKTGYFQVALWNLQKVVYDATTECFVRSGKDPEKENRQGWNINNRATAILFVKLPLAKRLRKEKELARELLGLTPDNQRGFDGWIKDVPGVYQDWWYGGKWPWPNENPPRYWANEKVN